ncbi:response regulator transcription factor [Loktanella sp. DJP18]|uniref:response regulator transcription factor n=1 Tax=Loktanella sp. DJP18 TaxID=3409788 RepID=UPI003BB5EA20
MSRIALVDDDRNVLTAVSATLRDEGFDVDTYISAQVALDAFSKREPDIAVINVMMPRMGGLEMITKLRQKSQLPVIFLSDKEDVVDEILGLRMGADDYIKKPFHQRLLAERIRSLLRRQSIASDDTLPELEKLIYRGSVTINPNSHSIEVSGKSAALTRSEYLILVALANRPGVVFSRSQLMEILCPDDTYVDERTIDCHIKRLRLKIRTVDATCKRVQCVRGFGYRFSVDLH